MKTPIYILGFLVRYGSLHGYKIKQYIKERASDFAQIKLPTIYYHLEKLQAKGYVTSKIEKEGKRPDRFVYSITQSGKAHFKEILAEALHIRFETEFELDAALFFFETLKPEDILMALEDHKSYLTESIKHIKRHRR